MARSARNHSALKPKAKNTATVVLLNKPYGFISQFSGGDKTLADLVPIKGVYPAGRLDKDSEGLLLLTDHGPLQHLISHPKRKWKKHYWAQGEGKADDDALHRLCTGVMLKDGPARAQSAEAIEPPPIWPRIPPIRERANIPDSWLDITLTEGRNRQVRRMTASINLPTLRLIRHQIGMWDIRNIDSGKYQTKTLSASELAEILNS